MHDYPELLDFPLPDLQMVLVEGGSFLMGDEVGDLGEACRPVHPVQVSTFYMCKFQTTQRLWEAIMGSNPSAFNGELRPVEQVSWNDIRPFLEKLNGIDQVRDFLKAKSLENARFRLPTEAEWEFAARGGNYSQGYTYAGSDKLKQVGWYRENSERQTHETGLLLANELGIYDMSGNVWEWCEDDWHETYEKAPKDGGAWIGSPRGGGRVVRGGGCFGGAVGCRPAYRRRLTPGYRGDNFGFRLCLSLQSVG